MFNRIEIPYEFTEDELGTIRETFSTHEDWEKSTYNKIKENIVKHLRKEQGNKCCYCKRELGFDIKEVDIEHIIPKSAYEEFTFTPLNLALSCPGCNTIKSKKSVLRKEPIKRYPRTSKNFLIIHPHFDNYEEHIEIVRQCLYAPLSEQGTKTVDICGLHRLNSVMKKQKEVAQTVSESSKRVNKLLQAPPEDISNATLDVMQLIADYINQS